MGSLNTLGNIGDETVRRTQLSVFCKERNVFSRLCKSMQKN